jgi:predicted nucleotidyltransferase component of viral defense system
MHCDIALTVNASVHQQSDDGFEVVAGNYIEAFAEKFGALAGRTRSRDFFDVVNVYRIGSMSKQGGSIWS